MAKRKNFTTVRISLTYFVVGVLWILFSDNLLKLLFQDAHSLSIAQTYKGWFYVVVTSLLLYNLLRTNEAKEKNTQDTAEKKYQMLVEGLPGVVFMDKFDAPQTTHYISPRIVDLLGHTPEEWLADKDIWEKSIHPDDLERVLAEDNRTNTVKESFRIEYRIRHHDGYYIWVKEDATLLFDEDGKPQFWQGILLDITEQKKVEDALRRREAILKAVGFSAEEFLKSIRWEVNVNEVLEKIGQATEASRVYIFQKDQTTAPAATVSLIYEWCEPGVEEQIHRPEMQNISMEDLRFTRWVNHFDLGLPIYGPIKDFPIEEQDFLSGQGILSLICIPIQTGHDWWGFIGFDECKSEREWTEAEIEALRAAANTMGTAIERKQFVEALQQSETSYRGLFNTVRDAIYIQDQDGYFLDVNDGAVEMYGYPKEFFVGKTPEILGAPGRNDLEKVTRAIQEAFKGTPQEFEFWGIRSNGEIFPKDVRLFKGIYDGKVALIAISQDITARKQYEEALRKQLRELSVLHSVALTESTAKEIDELIQQVTNIISDTLYSDNCGVLLLNETQDRLSPHYSYRGVDLKSMFSSLSIEKGLYGRAVRDRRSCRVADVALEPDYFEISKDIRSALSVPIISGAKLFGVLNVESKILDVFTEKDERLLNTIAGGMANTMERIQLFETNQRRLQQAEILREATAKLTSYFETDKLLEKIFDLLGKLIKFDSASIEMLAQGFFEIVAGKNIPAELIGIKYASEIDKWGNLKDSRQPIIIPDVQADDRFTKFDQTRYIRSWMGIPLVAQDKLIGYLNIDSRTPGYFNDEHAALAQTFANQAAVAIENTRLFELEKRQRMAAENLSIATSSLTNTLNMDDLFAKILEWLRTLVPHDSASIMLSQGDTVRLVAHWNLPKEFQAGREFPFTPKWQMVMESRKPLLVVDAQKDEIFEKWAGSEYIHGWIAVAMFVQDKLIGFLNLDSRTPGAFTEEHAALVQIFANQSAIAIEKARLFDLEKKRRETAETVRRATTALTNPLNLPALYRTIFEWLQKITPFDSASILEIEGDHLRLTAEQGLPNPEKALANAYPLDNVLCMIMNETGRALIIDDCSKDPRFEKWGEATHVRGWVGVPLIARGGVIGYITIDSRMPNTYSQNDAIAVQTFAQQAATSLENVKLYTETRQRLKELEMVSRISFALRAAHDTIEMFPILLNEIKSSVDTNEIAIWIYEADKALLIPKAASGNLIDLPKTTFKRGEGIVGAVFVSGEPRLSEEYSDDPLANHQNTRFIGQGWMSFAVPIRTTSEIIGVIVVGTHKPKRIESHHQRLLTTIAEIAGNAIHRSNLFERSEEQIRRLTTLREMDTAITSSLDLRITLAIITEHLTSKMGASAAAILVFNPDSQMLDYYAARGFQNPDIPRASVSIGNGFAGQILLNRNPFHVKDFTKEKSGHTLSLHPSENFKSYYAVPISSKGAARGILETYFKEPFTPNPDWVDFIQTLAGQAAIAIDNAQLFENLQRTNQELSLAYDTTLEGWGKALELRDKETQGHTRRVTNLTVELARQMGIPEPDLIHIRRGTLLHDIGKMGVPDHILRKPGPLTDEELAEMRMHPQYAFDLLFPIPYLRPALEIPYYHHEWWDGSGYPNKMKGGEIPLAARIFAVVDVWDALLSDRPYRKAWMEEKVMDYIVGLSGRQFDPEVVRAFFRMLKSSPKFIRSNFPQELPDIPKAKPKADGQKKAKTKKKR